jgi:hypothetical protein
MPGVRVDPGLGILAPNQTVIRASRQTFLAVADFASMVLLA